MATRYLPMLLELARLGAHTVAYQLTSAKLARWLGTSQQTAARWLVELEREGLIKREPRPRGQSVQLTSAGRALLRSVYHELDSIFGARPRVFEFVGQVASGVREGRYYVGQKGYRQQFKQVLGFHPYPGTLDLKLTQESLELKEMLRRLPGKHVKGFGTPEREFGPVKCFPATLRNQRVAVVLPFRTHLVDMLEVLAPQSLRKKFKLKDGDEVKVKVMA